MSKSSKRNHAGQSNADRIRLAQVAKAKEDQASVEHAKAQAEAEAKAQAEAKALADAATVSNKAQERAEVLAMSEAVTHGREALSEVVEGAARAQHGTASLSIAFLLAHAEGIMKAVSSYQIPDYRHISDAKAAGYFRDLILRDVCGCRIVQEDSVTKNGKTKKGKRLVYLPHKGNGADPLIPATKIMAHVYRALDITAGIARYLENLKGRKPNVCLPFGFNKSGDPCVSPDFLASYFKTPIYDSRGNLDYAASVEKGDRHHTTGPLLRDFENAEAAGREGDRYTPSVPIGRFGHTGSVVYGATLEHVAKVAEQWAGRKQAESKNMDSAKVAEHISNAISERKLSWAQVAESMLAHIESLAGLDDPTKANQALAGVAESMVDSARVAWPGLVRVLNALLHRLFLGKGDKPEIMKDELAAMRGLAKNVGEILAMYESVHGDKPAQTQPVVKAA